MIRKAIILILLLLTINMAVAYDFSITSDKKTYGLGDTPTITVTSLEKDETAKMKQDYQIISGTGNLRLGQVMMNIDTEKSEDIYGLVEREDNCDGGWRNITQFGNNTNNFLYYECKTTKVQREDCKRLSPDTKKCYYDNYEVIGTRQVQTTEDIPLSYNSTKKNGKTTSFLGNNIVFQKQKSLTFKLGVNFPIQTSGKFNITLQNDNGETLGVLDPWWNTSYTYSRKAMKNTTQNIAFRLNGSSGVCGFTAWVYHNASLYYNDCTDFVYANDTKRLPIDVEGNVARSYQVKALWGNASVKAVYHMNNGTNGTESTGVYNSSKIATGTPTSTSLGRFQKAINFSGETSNDIYRFKPIGTAVNGTYNFSISIWFKNVDSNDANRRYVITFYDERNMHMQMRGSTVDDLWTMTCAGGTYVIDYDPALLRTYNWYMFTITYWKGKNVTAYFNSTQAATKAHTCSQINAYANEFNTYGGYYNQYYEFAGTLDEFRIYSKLLTPAEITAYYQDGTTGVSRLGAQETQETPSSGSTCSRLYAGSGTRRVKASDYCNVTNTTDFGGNDLVINESGVLTVGAGGRIQNIGNIIIYNGAELRNLGTQIGVNS